MSISSYDELNIRPNNRRSEPYKEYFSKMSISDKEKQERIAFSEQMEEVVLYILSLIETTIESGETNMEYIQTQFYDKYLDVVLGYMLIDSYIKEYVGEVKAKQTELNDKVTVLENRPANETKKRWDSISDKLLWLFIAGVAGFLLAQMLPGVF